MSRISRWKIEKTKVKVVFRLQFHATHIPHPGWDKLFISFIPADSGKATAKTTKANVRNGTCKWADPIYETTRLLQDVRTKRYDEKLYKLVISMGSSRSSVLGEATINLADYADALKPSVVALPLHGSDSGTTLHVTAQLLTSKTGFREFEQQRELRERGLQTDQNRPDESSSGKASSSEGIINDQIDKVNTRVRFKEKSKDLASLEEEVGPNEEYADSAVGFDGSSNTSESLYAEKHDTSSTHEIDSLKSTVSGDLAGLTLIQSPQMEKGEPSDHRFLAQGTNDWVHAWSSDYSADNDLAAAYEENGRLRGCLEVAESSILELKQEVNSLQGHAGEIGYEAQKFAKQLASEIASGEEMAKEVSVLKSECSKLKGDLEQLKVSQLIPPFRSRNATEPRQDHRFQELQLRWIKGLLSMEDKIKELQNNACLGYHESDFRLLRSDVEELIGVLQDLKQGTGLPISSIHLVPSEGSSLKEIREMSIHKNSQFVSEPGFDVDLYQPELGMLHCLNIPGLVSHEPDSIDNTNAMKGKIFELLRELDESKAERESLAKKMDQMECYYEALVQELEEHQRQMLGELQNLRNEHATCLYAAASTKEEMETMRQDLNDQLLRLVEDKRDLDCLNKELERRTVTAEAALKRARLNYSIAVDQLQKDLELLSVQVLSMFETNENLIRHAFVDSSQSCFEGNPITTETQRSGLSEVHMGKLFQFQNQLVGKNQQQLGGDILLDDLKRSLHLQEGLYRKVEEEACEMHFVNLYLDVLSNVLQETLLEASDDVKCMREKINKLTRQLELSTESKEFLSQKLHSALNDVHALNEHRATCIAKCNDMARQNQVFEANLQNVTCENHLLLQKIAEWESLVMQYRSYESMYKDSAAENTELACLLEKKTLENCDLQNEIFSLQEELKTFRNEFDDLASVKEKLQDSVNFMESKLQNLLASYDKSINGLPPSESGDQDLKPQDLTFFMMQLEELQHNSCERILQLMEEKKGLVHERDIAQVSITAAKSEIALMKQKFEREILNMVDKFNVSNALVEQLQLDIEGIAYKLKVSSEVEEKYAQQHNGLFSDLDRLEVQLKEIISKNRDLGHEILELDTVASELDKTKLTAAKLAIENQALMASIQDKNEVSSGIASELESLKGSFQSLHDENQALMASSQDKEEESAQLASELSNLKDSIQSLHDENQTLMEMLQNKTEEAANLASELNSLKENLRFLRDENHALMASSQDKEEEYAKHAMELNSLKERLRTLHDENEAQMTSHMDVKEESTKLVSEIDSLKQSLQSLHGEKQALMISSRDKTEEASKLTSELNILKESLQSLHYENQVLMAGLQDKTEESTGLASELNRLSECLQILQHEKQALMVSSQDKTEESAHLASDMISLRKSLQSLHDELHDERSLREGLQSTISDLTSQLNEKQCQLLQFDHYKLELVHLKHLVSDLESEKARLCRLLLQSEECLNNAREEASTVSALKTQLSEMHESLIAADVRFIFAKTQYDSGFEVLLHQLHSTDRLLAQLQKKHIDTETTLNQCLASETQYAEENVRLLTNLNSIQSELEASIAENRLLIETNRVVRAELEEFKHNSQNAVLSYFEDKTQHSQEVEKLKCMLVTSEEEIDNLVFSKVELEVKVLLLKAKLDEQQAQIITLEGYYDESVMLQKHCSELNQRLSDQILKTEEFRNLSVHLKELKDKADAEYIQACEKREPEEPPVAMQESLRIAFIKEQYETRLQELKQQLSISKKHCEEMLLKLQDAIDEIENRKKSEASHLKKNEELGMKILELEAELQSVVSDKREKGKAYDLMKAKMECSLISLECCKEEKQKLEASLEECNKENSKIAVELNLMKESLENSKPPGNMQEEQNDESCEVDCLTMDASNYGEKRARTVPLNHPSGDPNQKCLGRDSFRNGEEAEHAFPASVDRVNHSDTFMHERPAQDVLVSCGMNGLKSSALINQDRSLHNDMKHLAIINDHFRAESLKSSMDHLSNELERMKNENSLLLQDDHDFDQKFPGLQSEFTKLQKANEELGSIFPLFNEFSGSGNALERVLALEIEIAEALQAKKRSSNLFHSSFLKQHDDEEAVFKSFRDINELIKDMLELKGRYTNVETELKEMHDRYSQLSLQFAEVEGERQKLMMTLKTVRASKKAQCLNRSSSASLGDHSS
uniref:C2 NT-type domain-containing protein n=1 Tax=Salix viminalis TaxID=40686 RepID=A0A6N2LTA1_SALVM